MIYSLIIYSSFGDKYIL
uniref:Uncharacterized protein n=1 Tax=Arundo donax TaxID=35708 RepID=A0A0A9FFC0_ARUDO